MDIRRLQCGLTQLSILLVYQSIQSDCFFNKITSLKQCRLNLKIEVAIYLNISVTKTYFNHASFIFFVC